MQNKLQELTDKLYQEGLSKGKKESDELLAKTKKEAADIITKAKEEARQIVNIAKEEAVDLKEKTETEIKMAFKQTLSILKNQIEERLIADSINAPITSITESTPYLKELIVAAITAFNPNEGQVSDLSILLPQNRQEELESFFKNEVSKQLHKSIDVKFSNKVQSGFKIGPVKEGYHISFSDKDLQLLFSEFLKPKTREFLFNNQ